MMSSDLADTAIADPPGVLAATRRLARPRVDAARRAALRDVWLALCSSRLVVWAAGAGTVATLGFGPVRHVYDPPGLTRGFGWSADVLAAPAARWDAAWYLTIAHWGYRPDLGAFSGPRDAFFALYPLGLAALAKLGTPPILAGILLSLGALTLALYWLHRLTALEAARLRLVRGREVARLAVLSCAFGPMAFFLSAVYSESLYLALSVGAFLFARRGRWPLAAVLASLAGATRSSGVVLALPLALFYLYGPREDRRPDRPERRLLPRYRLRPDALWLGLVPVGLGLYMGYLAAAGGDVLGPFHAQEGWGRHFGGPFAAVWQGTVAAGHALGQLGVAGAHNLELLAFLAAGTLALVGVLRLLPSAYGAYVLGALGLPLSYPVASQPLMSLPRFLLVLFPLNIWLAVRLSDRPWLARATLGLSALALAFFTASFATWHWVA
ncbi:MAG TPA: mannosyltransferase family protein [Solirubrobacteraceae bacterium]|jgi:hypothetical protein|nr:mannosyltransferase family protein [Solirubrobacteraceae bacterium]